MWRLQFDGLYEPRHRADGYATFGFVVEHDGQLLHEAHGLLLGPHEGGSANVAEFGALLAGLQWLVENKHDDEPLRIEGDSRLVCETVAGRWKLRSERLVPLRDWAQRLLAELGGADITKVPREANARADALTRLAYHEARKPRQVS